MDDDVQYLGTKLAAPEHLDNPCHAHSSATDMSPRTHPSLPSAPGITLHVDKCGDRPPHDLTYYRTRSGYVNIGRKSASDDRSMRRENDDHNAVFACQVVSAKHAKLVLSDSGQVYIVDLHSRHGTHLSRRGETTRMLQPEVETLLADGDVLTFGKVVGAGSYHVSPVTVLVELLTGPSSSESSADRALGASRPSSPVLELRPHKLSSGRYGLIAASILESDSSHSFSSISSDAASSQSGQESDVEDEHICVPAFLRVPQGKPSVKIPAFRTFIGDICHSAVSRSPDILDVADEPMEDVPGSPPSARVVIHPSPVVAAAESFPVPRSPSPIDSIMTPSPPSEAHQAEPAVIGAWPASRPESPRHSSLDGEVEQSGASLVPEPDREPESIPIQTSPCRTGIPPPCPTKTFTELVQCLNPLPPYFPTGGPFSNSIASDFGLPSIPPPPLPPPPPRHIPPFHPLHKVVTERVSFEIKGTFKSVDDRITALQETVNDLKSRQTVTEEDVVDLQSHVEMLEPDSERLLCRISGAERNIASLSMLQGRMTALQNQVTALRTKLDAQEHKPVETPMDDVRACADALNSLVSEMKALREEAEKRIEANMEAVQSARAEALDALKGVVAEAERTKSSKRKREDEEAEEDSPEVAAVPEPVACSPPVVVNKIPLPEVPAPQVPIPQVPISIPDTSVSVPAPKVPAPEVPTPVPARPRKRARTTMYTVAHTAAAMAIGAAATWSALAFS